MTPIHREDKPRVKLRMELFKFGYCREQDVDVLRRGEKRCWTRSGAQLEVDDAVLEKGLQDGGCGVADGGFVGEEGVDVFAEEGEEALFFSRCIL